MESTAQTRDVVGARARARRRRWGRVEVAESGRARIVPRAGAGGAVAGAVTRQELEDLWDRHGSAAYALACALLGNEAAAAEAVRLAMTDLAGSSRGASADQARRCLVGHVFRRAQEHAGGTSGAVRLPPVMAWVSRLARLQRASLALCMFGGLTHREAAAMLDVPPGTVADLLTAGLRELRCLAAGATAATATPR